MKRRLNICGSCPRLSAINKTQSEVLWQFTCWGGEEHHNWHFQHGFERQEIPLNCDRVLEYVVLGQPLDEITGKVGD